MIVVKPEENMLSTVLSLFLLLQSPQVEILCQNQLDTAEGRTRFLTEKLQPFTEQVEQLNNEIGDLAGTIENLSPEDTEIQADLTGALTQKTDQMLRYLPILQLAMSVNDDLQKIDDILTQTDPLSADQQTVVDRLTNLCSSLGN